MAEWIYWLTKYTNREHTIQTLLVGTISIFTVTSVDKTNIVNFIGMVCCNIWSPKNLRVKCANNYVFKISILTCLITVCVRLLEEAHRGATY